MSTLKEVLRTLPGYTLLRRMRRALSAATIQFNQTQTDQYRCSIDSFPLTSAGPVEHVSGWYLPATDEPVRIEVRLDEVTIAELSRRHRHDLADAFPNSPAAVLGGFGGDVVIPDHVRAGDTVTIAVRATSGTQQHTLIERSVRYAPQDASRLRVRHRPWGPIFQDPRTAQPIKLGTPFGAQTMQSDGGIPIIMGVPHFLPAGSAPLIRLLETGATHPYSCYADDVMAHCSGLVLDLGCLNGFATTCSTWMPYSFHMSTSSIGIPSCRFAPTFSKPSSARRCSSTSRTRSRWRGKFIGSSVQAERS